MAMWRRALQLLPHASSGTRAAELLLLLPYTQVSPHYRYHYYLEIGVLLDQVSPHSSRYRYLAPRVLLGAANVPLLLVGVSFVDAVTSSGPYYCTCKKRLTLYSSCLTIPVVVCTVHDTQGWRRMIDS
jgi:hypothetical protein